MPLSPMRYLSRMPLPNRASIIYISLILVATPLTHLVGYELLLHRTGISVYETPRGFGDSDGGDNHL